MRLKNMSPRPTQNDTTHMGGANTVVISNEPIPALIGANGENLRVSQLRPAMRFALWLMRPAFPTLREHVCDVVLLCAQEQMIGIHAQRIIAAVQHLTAIWNRTVSQLKREAMRSNYSTMAHVELSVAVLGGRHPQPAFIRSLNFAPKSFLYTFASHVTSYRSLVRGATGADYTVTPRYFTTVMP